MLTRKEDHLRDGKHCDLCGCTSPAVRCDKCNSQIFCLSCDDMYHRHPKRRSHLRKAVDSFNASAFRPVTPNKPPPGDPSKMPIPPPRKKKPRNFFGTLMRGSPTQEGPALPKKEFSWTDRLGSIKRFMSNRPLPPLPVESSPSPEPILPVGTIYQNVPDKPNMQPILPRWSGNPTSTNDVHPMNGNSTSPELDRRPLSPSRQQQCLENGQWRTNRMRNSIGETGKWRQGSKIPSDGAISPIASSAEDKHRLNHSGLMPGYATFRKITPHRGVVRSRSPSPSPTKEQNSSMHQSASLTDLHSLPTTPGPYPYFAPHHPPFFPFPPSHSYAHLNCPQCYAGQWPPPSADNCEYCNASDDNSQQKHAHHPLASRVKRSQSVMYDPMHNPVPYFPYPPGFGPFYPHGHHIEAPPSPASSARSLQNTRHSRKKHGDDNISVASSVRSRGKSSSSHQKSPDNESMEISSDEQQDDDDDDDEDRGKEPVIKNQEMMEVERQTAPSPQSNASKIWIPTKPWSCEYCTYLNSAGVRICTVCCKTISNVRTPSNTTLEQNLNPPESQKLPSANSRLIPEENMSLSNNGHLDAKANTMQITALEEAEKKKKSKRKNLSR